MNNLTNKLDANLSRRDRTPAIQSGAVDAAFADLPDIKVRVDSAQTSATGVNYGAETERLISKISEQLQAIEQQRARLARLLGDLQCSSSSKNVF